MTRVFLRVAGMVALTCSLCGCARRNKAQMTIGVSFETLQTEFWVAGFEAIKSECARGKINFIEAVADGDANRQLEQVRSFITRRVDGIILVPKDAHTCVPMIKAANEAKIPIVLFNRPSAEGTGAKSVAVVADNFSLTRETVDYMIAQAKQSGRLHKAMVILGDLGDINAIGRRDGFEAAVKDNGAGVVDVVARVPSEWNQEKAQAGVANALQAHPDISFIFTSSDFLLPSIVSALKAAGRYTKTGQPGHVFLGGFDGDATAFAMLEEGYLDATGVQDVYFEARKCVEAIVDLKAGKVLPALIRDPGFVIHQDNLKEKAAQMWGANVKKK
ncbi:MAG: sugar ABC transporter substrate-binding protein [Verrucomicrobiales bacterium]